MTSLTQQFFKIDKEISCLSFSILLSWDFYGRIIGGEGGGEEGMQIPNYLSKKSSNSSLVIEAKQEMSEELGSEEISIEFNSPTI